MQTPWAEAPGPRAGAPARAALSRSVLWHAVPWLIILAAYFTAGGYLSLGANVLIMILLTLSLDLVLGHAGIVTLGHAAYFGFGAYAAGNFAIHAHPDPLVGLAFATVLTGAFGLATGALILHTEGVTLMMLTLAIGSLVAEFANHAHVLTGGDDGLQGIRPGPLLGLFRFDLFGHTAFLYCAGVLLAWFLITWRVLRSPFGRSLDGIRQSPRRMRAIGTPVWRRLVVAYGLSAAMAGSAGALSAQTTRYASLSALSILVSGTAVMCLALGGTRRLYGAFLGATVYVVVQSVAAEIDPFRWMLFVGALLMGVVLFLERGLISLVDLGSGGLEALRRRWVRP
jgi:branched-chain amino acid transport system permease protein